MTRAGHCGLFLFLASSLSADVTLRYLTSVQVNDPNAVDARAPDIPVYAIQCKGNLARLESGDLVTIVDGERGAAIVLDTRRKLAASGTEALRLTEANRLLKLPAGRMKELARAETGFESRPTGQASVIRGVAVTERRDVLTFRMPAPGGAVALTMTYSVPRPAQIERHPWLSELARNAGYRMIGWGGTEALSASLGALPDFAAQLRAMTERRIRDGAVFGNRIEVFIAEPGASPGGTPVAQIDEILTDVSIEPLAGDRFTAPPGYKRSTFREILMLNPPAPLLKP